jgi:hypothetical protein
VEGVKEVAAMVLRKAHRTGDERPRLETRPSRGPGEDPLADGNGDLDTAGGIVRFTLASADGTTDFVAGIVRFPLGSSRK